MNVKTETQITKKKGRVKPKEGEDLEVFDFKFTWTLEGDRALVTTLAVGASLAAGIYILYHSGIF